MGTHLCRIHFPLDDVEDGNVAVVGLPVSPCGHHHVFRLQQPSHHVQDCGFPHTGHLHRPAKGQREQVCCSLPSCCLVHTHTHTHTHHTHTRAAAPWGWSHMQSHMQDREIPTSHNGIAKPRNRVSVEAPAWGLSGPHPAAQQGLGVKLS